MLTFLGASAELSAADLADAQLEGASIVHVEGYLAYNPTLVTAVMKHVREAGARVSASAGFPEPLRPRLSL